MLRILINFFPDATHFFCPLVQVFAIISIIYASFSTIIQEDTKKLVAYSSIAHTIGPLEIFFFIVRNYMRET